MMNPLRMFFPKRMVGIDVGTSSIKIVELSYWGAGKILENYGEMKSSEASKEPLLNAKIGTPLLSTATVSTAIKGILEEAKIKTKEAIFSLPDFSTFCTSFDMPPIPEKEIPEAIYYNASQYITLPIKEVVLDWQIIRQNPKNEKDTIKVFLVAVPNQVVQEYQSLSKAAGLRIYALEAEALGIVRSLVKDKKKSICLIDIGVQSSTINIINNGFLRNSYSFNFYSGQLSKAVSSALGVGYEKAEEIKNKEGIMSQQHGVADTLYLLIDPLIAKIKNILAEFAQKEQKQMEEIYLTGGTANLPGLKEYFHESLGKSVTVPNCFANLLYPPILEETLKEMAPGFSAAVGVALGGLEKR